MVTEKLVRELATVYGDRCVNIAQECTPDDILDAMKHPDFAAYHRALFEKLVFEFQQRELTVDRQPFASIQIGTFKDVNELRQALQDKDYNISRHVNDLLNRVKFVDGVRQVKLYSASNAQLGYPNGCTVSESFGVFEKFGIEKMPDEAGSQCRLQISRLPSVARYLFYTDTIFDLNSDPCLFETTCVDNHLELDCETAFPDSFYGGSWMWVYSC